MTALNVKTVTYKRQTYFINKMEKFIIVLWTKIKENDVHYYYHAFRFNKKLCCCSKHYLVKKPSFFPLWRWYHCTLLYWRVKYNIMLTVILHRTHSFTYLCRKLLGTSSLNYILIEDYAYHFKNWIRASKLKQTLSRATSFHGKCIGNDFKNRH